MELEKTEKKTKQRGPIVTHRMLDLEGIKFRPWSII
jgi:hypothetical protein